MNERPAERYRQLWQSSQPPDLDAFLAQTGPIAPLELAAILRVDQAMRWANGSATPVEEYLRRFPSAADDTEAALDLIHHEYLLAYRDGRTPNPDEFVQRFPDHADTLRLQIELHDAVEGRAHDADEIAATHLPNTQPTTGEPLGIPEQFGRYRILDVLGRGGMGTVYSAYDCKLERRVALKVPHFTPGDDVQLSRFQREAKIAAGFNERHLCPVYDVGEIEGVHFLTMPIIEGETLASRIKREQRLTPADAVRLVKTIARALAAAHEAGVIHRDLKPANILLDKNGEPIVTDFGLARNSAKRGSGDTSSGVFVGTPAYAAPEQIGAAESASPSTDVYALGSILFELLTGRQPFVGPVEEILRTKLRGDVERPSRFDAGLSPTLDAVCLKAMAHSPAQRFASMTEFADALDACDLAPRRARLNRRRAIASAALGLAAGIVIGFFAWPKTKTVTPLDDRMPAESIWCGEVMLDPKDPTGWEPATLWITDREGETLRGQFGTNDGDYAWFVEGTLKDDRIQWRYMKVIREKAPTNSVVSGAKVEGTFDGRLIDVNYLDPADGSRAVIRLRPHERDPRAADAHSDRAWKFNGAGQLDSAIQLCNLALKLDDLCVRALICRANSNIQKRAIPLAIADLDRAATIEPDKYLIYVDRSWAWGTGGEFKKALADAEKAISMDSEKAEGFYQRGAAYEGMKDHESALADFTKAIDLNGDNPEYPWPLIERGRVYRLLGMEELAKKDFERARKLRPHLDIPD